MSKAIFRGKDKRSDNWIEGTLDNIDEPYRILFRNPKRNNNVEIHTVVTETVGQFTGFCDKNKRKAFQGDILSHCGGLDYGVIKYGEYSNPFTQGQHIGFFIDWVAGEDKDDLRKDLGYWLKAGTAEIVGNIYDNTELLAYKKKG